mmetsp:Transcript_102248/g.142369  ORF Transcript_102248/g.142369 Transcript_102248/m.142369 type:complete len:82 (-) Transcript_102248:1038-1283(-)
MLLVRALKAENEKLKMEGTNKDVCIESMKAKLAKFDYKKMKNKIKKRDEELLKLKTELAKYRPEGEEAKDGDHQILEPKAT